MLQCYRRRIKRIGGQQKKHISNIKSLIDANPKTNKTFGATAIKSFETYVADTKNQLVDAQKQLADTKNQLADAQKQLADAQKQLADASILPISNDRECELQIFYSNDNRTSLLIQIRKANIQPFIETNNQFIIQGLKYNTAFQYRTTIFKDIPDSQIRII